MENDNDLLFEQALFAIIYIFPVIYDASPHLLDIYRGAAFPCLAFVGSSTKSSVAVTHQELLMMYVA